MTAVVMTETECRQLARMRSGGRCELAVRDRCLGRAASASHRQRRSAGGLWLPSNILDSCGSGTTGCHGWIGSRPAWADKAGLTVPSWADPVRVPAYIEPHGWARGWWHLGDDGSLTACAALSRPPWAEGARGATDCSGLCVQATR